MKTQEYVKQFKLDREHYNFNREKFMEALGQNWGHDYGMQKNAGAIHLWKILACHQRTAG